MTSKSIQGSLTPISPTLSLPHLAAKILLFTLLYPKTKIHLEEQQPGFIAFLPRLISAKIGI